MINYAEPETLQPFLSYIVVPLYRIVEDPNSQDEQMAELQQLAREVQDLLQQKIGVTLFAEVYNETRRMATEKRQSRKAAIAVGNVANPASEAERRARRNEHTAKLRKRKAQAFAEKKVRFGVARKRVRMEE